VKVGDEYIMYYSVSSGGSQTSAIGYATSSTMEYGSWTDHGATGIASSSSTPYNAIDPTLFLDPVTNGYYMSFGSYWDGIYVVRMNSAATQVASGATYTNLAYAPAGAHALEGSFLYYHNEYYYLFTSVGNSGSFDSTSLPAAGAEYHVFVCRSSSITGPFVDSTGLACLEGGGNLLLASHDYVYAPGGEGILEDPTFGTVLYYHYGEYPCLYCEVQIRLWHFVDQQY
jgi:arabinan endo-1,5-alpha-L-arabinosidase